MAEVIRMPKMSDTMEEGVIANWNVKVGDSVSSGDILAEVETDKATMDMESYYDGTLLYIAAEKGEAVPVDGIMAIIGKPGENYQSLLGSTSATETPAAEPTAAAAPAPAQPAIDTSNIKATIVRMPLLSDTMTEGVIQSWLKQVGDDVQAGDALAEIETDKATMELESYDEGTLLYIGVKEGDAAPVNGIIAIIGDKNADYQKLLAAEGTSGGTTAAPATPETATAPAAAASAAAAPAETDNATPAVNSDGSRVKASPLAKRLAEEKGIDIAQVKGSGTGGRIVKSDIDNFVPSAKPATAPAAKPAQPAATVAMPTATGEESYEEIKLSQMRKAIARGFSSELPPPEFYITMEITMDNAIVARNVMNETSPVKISFNDMVIKACAAALTKHPAINSSWKGDHIRQNQHVNIGMAVAVPDGLLMPVVRYANTLSLSQIAATTKNLGAKAKNKELQPKDWEGNTFTVSNLGMFGVDSFTSIINNRNNESCILAVGGIKETVGVKDGNFFATNVMKVTMTCDHRVVDGATGAAFLVTLKELLEEPYRLLI